MQEQRNRPSLVPIFDRGPLPLATPPFSAVIDIVTGSIESSEAQIRFPAGGLEFDSIE